MSLIHDLNSRNTKTDAMYVISIVCDGLVPNYSLNGHRVIMYRGILLLLRNDCSQNRGYPAIFLLLQRQHNHVGSNTIASCLLLTKLSICVSRYLCQSGFTIKGFKADCARFPSCQGAKWGHLKNGFTHKERSLVTLSGLRNCDLQPNPF